ncbi:lipopolysaccharide biosynthesis protein [Hungatella hathewayi]
MQKNQSRTLKTLKNSSMSLVSYIVISIISFVTRTIFIYKLGAENLGLTGLFTSILSILSLAELGVGTAIVYFLYLPLSQKDNETVIALVNYYRRFYHRVAFLIFSIGIILVPFLQFFISENLNIWYLRVIFLMYISDTAMSYICSYKRSILLADQKNYIDTYYTLIFLLLKNIIQIVLLLAGGGFVVYLLVQLITNVTANLYISARIDRMYPFLQSDKNLKVAPYMQKDIHKKVIGLLSSKIGTAIVSGTDNILIAGFEGIQLVGIYSNFSMIVNTVSGILGQVTKPITASVGNLNTEVETEKKYIVFKRLNFLYFIVTIYCTEILLSCFKDLITLWLGSEYLLDQAIIFIILINFYIKQMRQPIIFFIDGCGLFWELKWKNIIEAITNLIASLFFLKYLNWGIYGVLLGTLCSAVMINLWWEPYAVYKYVFSKKVYQYIKQYLFNFGILIISYIIIQFLAFYLCRFSTLGNLMVKSGLVIIITSLSIFCLYRKQDEMSFSVSFLKSLLLRKLK